jgi:hypothetical protein
MGNARPQLKMSSNRSINLGRPSRAAQTVALIGLFIGLGIIWAAYELGQIRAGHNRFEAQQRYTLLEREAYRRVEEQLAGLQAEILTQQEDLAFYRGIVADQQTGLRIQDLELLRGADASSFTMRLVLAQAIRADRRISGYVELNVEGIQDGQELTLSLGDLAGQADGKSQLAFSFRYFQNLQADLVLPRGFAPARVTVKLTPNGKSAKPLEKSFDWAVQAG